MTKCMRNYYDEPVNIRATKLVAAEKGYDAYMSKITPPAPVTDGRKVAVIGGGPTGMSAAYFVGRAGIPVTLFEKSGPPGRHRPAGDPRLPHQRRGYRQGRGSDGEDGRGGKS